MQVLSLLEIEHLLSTCFPHAQFFNLPRKKTKPANVDQLRDGLAQIADAAKAIQKQADDENRALTRAESQAIDALYARFEDTESAIDDAEDGEAGRGTGRKTEPDGVGNGTFGRTGFADGPTWRDENAPARSIAPGAARNFAAMFPQLQADRSQFRSAHDLFATLHSGRSDPRLISAATAHREGAGADGGFLVPSILYGELLDSSLESEIIRPRATVIPMASNNVMAPFFSYEDRSTGIAGFAATWTAEGATMTPQTGDISQIGLRASKLSIFTKATNELVMDGPLFERQLYPALVGATGFELDAAFISGTGVGQPRGILNDPALITVSKESGQAADTLVYANLVNMCARLHAAGWMRSIWVVNQTALPQLLSLSLPIGDAGSHIPVLREADSGFTLLSRPVVLTEKLPQLGDVGDIMLIDPSQYVIGVTANATIATSDEKYFDTDERAYRITLRVDGRGGWTGPATPRNGSTLSWCVALEAR